MQASRRHSQIVAVVQQQVKQFFNSGQQARIYHGGTNSTRQANKSLPPVDISNLNQIIEINPAERYVIVEPNVPLDKLLAATLKHNLMPPVVCELPGITVGGAILGGAGESSSFKYGCVNEASLEYEVVLGNGQKVSTSAKNRSDLFYGLAASCGSLGIITLIKLKLVLAKPHVRLEYRPVNSFKAAQELIVAKAKEKVDFIDGIIFSKTQGVVMLGYYDNASKLPQATFHRKRDEWFYLHAQKISEKRSVYSETIPIRDYLFRYDRGAFWVGRFGCEYLHAPFTRLTRRIFAPLFTTRRCLRFLHGAGLAQRFLTQDICLPEKNLVAFLQFIDKTFGAYPLWLCPLKPATKDKLSPNNIKTELVVSVGVYDKLDVPYQEFVRFNRQLEQKVLDLDARKVLYAHSYYPEKDFWRLYDHKPYNKLRIKYQATKTFPDLYAKTFVGRAYPEPVIAKGWLALIKQPFN
ncbi:MAG TPA: FAD-binding oxidoreductase [Candidatus Binatia bacterium]|nr:FAD-binding oxidoreductase [Candidatus Binatia bacterium]